MVLGSQRCPVAMYETLLGRRSRATGLLFALLAVPLAPACKSEVPAEQVDNDADGTPDLMEDRDQDGTVDPGETDPSVVDTDGDGIEDPLEVSTLACSRPNDRPFEVYDVPGADSMVLIDAQVRERSMLRTMDNRAPGAALVDPDLDVASVLIAKRPEGGVATPSAERDVHQRQIIAPLGAIVAQRTRAFTTVQGFDAEQATYTLRLATPMSTRALAAHLGTSLLGGVALTGLPSGTGAPSADVVVQLLTIYRSATRVVILAAVAAGSPPSDGALIRLEELTDGTNVARHGSFTRHVCDQFEAKDHAMLDIIWVIDDSGSMEDDQEAVRNAASALGDVLTSANVDFRNGVTRHRATDQVTGRRGQLEGEGMTPDLQEFMDTVVVGADGGWEPGLETGILAIERLLPKTPAGQPADPEHLREDAALVIIHLSDERDQEVECVACGGCEDAEGEQRLCTGNGGQAVIDRYIEAYTERGAVNFALVGDLPNGCQQSSTRDDFEPGQGYVEVANATGGHFGSLCGDMRTNVADIARAATGISSEYELSSIPASATIRVAKGPAGQGVNIPRSRTNGFDYDAARNRIIFYGDARPMKGDEIVVGYRRWDWKGNPNRPGDPSDGCDLCEVNTVCDPELDIVLCEPVCGEVVCNPGEACLPDTASCGDPNTLPPPPTEGCDVTCDPGLVCDPAAGECVVPCEETGCVGNQICSSVTHLCQVPNF